MYHQRHTYLPHYVMERGDLCSSLRPQVSTNTCSAVADFISWVIHQGIEHQLHYLDDFLLLVAPNSNLATAALELVLWILGILVAAHKTEVPATTLYFLGIHNYLNYVFQQRSLHDHSSVVDEYDLLYITGHFFQTIIPTLVWSTIRSDSLSVHVCGARLSSTEL
jgi:hypothetical protein